MSRWGRVVSLLGIVDQLMSTTLDALAVLDTEIDSTLTTAQIDTVHDHIRAIQDKCAYRMTRIQARTDDAKPDPMGYTE